MDKSDCQIDEIYYNLIYKSQRPSVEGLGGRGSG